MTQLTLPENAALLVVDVQQGLADPFWGPRNNPGAEAHIASLLAAFRQAGRPVIHIMHDSVSPVSPLRPGQPGNQVKPEAQPFAGEPVYRKTVNSAFIGTALESELRARNIDTLVIVGLTTNHCVSTTARMAANLGFHTYVVEDATAAFDQPAIDGRLRPAEDVHIGALSDLSGEFATIVQTTEVERALKTGKTDKTGV